MAVGVGGGDGEGGLKRTSIFTSFRIFSMGHNTAALPQDFNLLTIQLPTEADILVSTLMSTQSTKHPPPKPSNAQTQQTNVVFGFLFEAAMRLKCVWFSF